MTTELTTGVLTLKPGREKPVLNRHPWVFSGAVHHSDGRYQPGDLVTIVSKDGRFLATAYVNPHSQIRARILSWDANEAINDDFWQRRLHRAHRMRQELDLDQTTAYRLVNAEADGLPGLIVDRYNDYLVMQCLTQGIDRRKKRLAELLAAEWQPAGILERSDASVRAKEGLPEENGLLWGTPPPDPLLIQENGHTFAVDLSGGHKTGFYLDQRVNRAIVCAPRHVAGKEILNVFAYTGGFAVYAAAHGAGPITNIDSSLDVLELAEQNVLRAAAERPSDEYLLGDAFMILRDFRDNGRQFDVVILDPPKFAHSQRDLERAARGYKDLNWLALRLLRPGGLLATFSCSGLVSADLFQKIVFSAAVDAGRDVQILQPLAQAPDHPVLLSFPESAYLKGLLCRVGE
ncbi:MAG: class I SAM-dependent rRNA methyltransferase [Ardenticatenaceae bacterium]|nr:class I SAM-dependent rRNA methyltransferase [Ardenticatenaceae bacterium]MCB8987674.1 class I SAM-dependent rRNA methyltransferase [Ardenticatenaceae bacterium]